MAKEYKVGEKYYLPVIVSEIYPPCSYPIKITFYDGISTSSNSISDEPDILLTAEDIATVINTERDDALEELKSRNAELEALLKEVTATRDEAVKQNNELIADRNNWKEAAQRYHDNAKVADAAADNLRKENSELKAKVTGLITENEKLKADSERLNTWYMEANRTASEAAEANDELKAKIAELRDEVATLKAERCSLNGQVGKNLAEIQALSSDVHFLKEACKKQKAECDELKGRYDELDSVNKEQAEKIRKLDAECDTWERNAKAWKMTSDGMSKRAEELQAENEKLNNRNKYLESEKNRKPIVHVLTNDGHVYAFTSSGKVSVKYHTELNILMIEDGEKTIAGFSRGDKPGDLSAWWMG